MLVGKEFSLEARKSVGLLFSLQEKSAGKIPKNEAFGNSPRPLPYLARSAGGRKDGAAVTKTQAVSLQGANLA